MKRLILISLLFLSGYAAMAASPVIVDDNYVAEAIARNAVVWDIRPGEAYARGHIAGAVSIGDAPRVLRDDNTEDFIATDRIEKILGTAGLDPRRETIVAQGDAAAAASDGESYKAALARWQSLRQAAAAPGRATPAPTSPDLPTAREVWTALGSAPPSDDPVRIASEESPPIVDATAPQPPMPPAWPGEARRPGGEPSSPEDGPDNPPDNVVQLPRSRRP